MHIFHKWTIIGAYSHRQEDSDDFGKYETYVCTEVLYKCYCNKTKTKRIRGAYTLAQLTDTGAAVKVINHVD